MKNLNQRLGIIAAVFIIALLMVVPNFINVEKMWWPIKDKMTLGLDIQGGSHLVLRVDVEGALAQDARKIATTLAPELEKEKVLVKGVQVATADSGELKIELLSAADQSKVVEAIDKYYGRTFQVVEKTDQFVTIKFSEVHVRDFRNKIVEQAINTIRNRIDEFGVAEPSITAQGSDRILVQLPGIKDAASAKNLINQTARLDFMMVSQEIPREKLMEMVLEVEKTQNLKMSEMKYSLYVDKLNAALKDKLPANTILLFEKDDAAKDMVTGRIPYLLKTLEVVAGDHLQDARVGQDQTTGRPNVAFAFDSIGAREFGELTTKHVKEQMAIVLDKVVKSAPVINTPITGGRGEISMGRSRDSDKQNSEATLLSMALRAGALPATLEQLEERTIGPTLGADAIAKGQKAAVIGAILVFVFMALYYRGFGVIADISLLFNIMIVMAVLSGLGATLTLPGIAGLALTIGIAVDANVIIYERIREELRLGKQMLQAIDIGYHRGFSAIIDANITSIAVCFVLMYFGTGPIRGFAITLLSGLVIQTFTAIYFTRALVDFFVGRMKWNLSIKW